MNFNIYNSLILAGIIQGIIFGVIVPFSKKYKSKSTLFLVAMIVSYSLGNLQYLLPDIGIISLRYMYSYIYFPLASLIAPLLYFHVLFFLFPNKNVSLFEKALFFPFIGFFFIISILRAIFIFKGSNFISFEHLMAIVIIHEVLSIILSLFILIKILFIITHYKKTHELFRIEVIKPRLNWLLITVIILLLLTILWAYITFINLVYPENAVSYYSLWLGIAATIYWLGHIGIYKFGIIEERKKLRKHILEKNASIATFEIKNEYIKTFQYLLIEQKMYLNPSITLEKIAELMKISSGYLSRIIKTELHTNFTDYINTLRVNEAKSHLENPQFSNYTIIAIGLEAGFNSKSAFFDVFKKTTGITPSIYKSVNTSNNDSTKMF